MAEIKLIVISGPDVGSDFTFTGSVVVMGRSIGCDLMLHDSALGRRHCEIRHEGNQFILVDLSSTNGTFLNNRPDRITSQTLHSGDEIRLGKSRVRIEIPGQEAHDPPQPETIQQPTSSLYLTPDSSATQNKASPGASNKTAHSETPPSSDERTVTQVSANLQQSSLILHIIEGNAVGQVFNIQPDSKPLTFGRGKDADVLIDDHQISRIHFTIESTSAGFLFIDNNSRNGTFLKGQTDRVQRLLLQGGEEIRVGTTRLLVTLTFPLAKSSTSGQEEATWKIRLRVVEGKDTDSVLEPLPGTQRFTVGRDNSADLIIHDRRVSRVHFAIEFTPTGFLLIDNDSHNGTFLKGKSDRIHRLLLQGGEEIQIGETSIKIEIIPPPETTLVTPFAHLLGTAPISPTGKEIGSADVQSQPRLTILHRIVELPRAWVALGVSWLATMFCAVGVWFINPTVLTSAALSDKHAQWENECSTCHTPWRAQLLSSSCSATNCHAGELQVSAQTHDRCEECHTEHRGRNFAIRGTAADCWHCHATAFPRRAVWRYYSKVYRADQESPQPHYRLTLPTRAEDLAAWQHDTPQKATGLIFAHAAHAKDSQQSECLACHQPLPGTVINALGTVGAFPSHEECIDCHAEVGSRDPQAAKAKASPQCQKCHTQTDWGITRESRSSPFVQFSHDNHAEADCERCHFTVKTEQAYRPIERSTVYSLPMEACVSCHQEEHVTTSCLACHRSHHRMAPQSTPAVTKTHVLSLGSLLGLLLCVEIGAGIFLSMRPRV